MPETAHDTGTRLKFADYLYTMPLNMSWTQWLHANIDTPYGMVQRRAMLHMFVKDGLVPFLRAHGYELRGSVQWIQSAIASGLYDSRRKHTLESKWPAPTNVDEDPEDYDHFHQVIDQEAWKGFWENWGAWEDVDGASQFGPERRLDIEFFVWNHIDLGISPQTKVVDRLFEEEEPQEEGGFGRRHEDIYIREVAESNEWGGYRR